MKYYQLSISELPGPTALYSGLSKDNVASLQNRQFGSNPCQLAMQSLHRMKLLLDAGVPQVIFAPHRRPDRLALHNVGFSGDLQQLVEQADKAAPCYLASVLSTSSVWTANAATVTPSLDSSDGKVHITTANLNSHYHRSIEVPQTHDKLARVFADSDHFALHSALSGHFKFSDEGAANHMRFGVPGKQPGMNIFIYGNDPARDKAHHSRQTLWACESLFRLHQLEAQNALFVRQSRQSIDAGIFHNDIIAMSHHDLLVYHQSAYHDHQELIDNLQARGVCCVQITAEEFSIEEALSTYFFNSEFITTSEGELVLIMSDCCRDQPTVSRLIDKITSAYGKPLTIQYADLSDSIRNGGGPACLRLRVQLNQTELAAIDSRYLLSADKLKAVTEVVQRRYRKELHYEDVLKTDFLADLCSIYDEIEQVLAWN